MEKRVPIPDYILCIKRSFYNLTYYTIDHIRILYAFFKTNVYKIWGNLDDFSFCNFVKQFSLRALNILFFPFSFFIYVFSLKSGTPNYFEVYNCSGPIELLHRICVEPRKSGPAMADQPDRATAMFKLMYVRWESSTTLRDPEGNTLMTIMWVNDSILITEIRCTIVVIPNNKFLFA